MWLVASGYLIGQCSSRIRRMSTITLPVSSPPLKPPRGSLCICRIKEELVYKTQLSPQWLLLTICFPFPVAITPWALCISPSLCKLLYPPCDLWHHFPLGWNTTPFSPLPEFIYTQLWVSVQRCLPWNSCPTVHISEFLSFIARIPVESLCLFVWWLFTNIWLLTRLKFYEDRDYISFCLLLYSQKSV